MEKIHGNTNIKIFDMKSRPEDFGHLVTDGYHYAVVDDGGLSFIDYLNSCNKTEYYLVDSLIAGYLCKFSFENENEKMEAYDSLLDVFNVLLETRLVFPKR